MSDEQQVAVELDASLKALAIELPEEVWKHHKQRVLAFADERNQQIIRAAVEKKEMYEWLYAIWMAFLADEKELMEEVLPRMSAWMSEREGL